MDTRWRGSRLSRVYRDFTATGRVPRLLDFLRNMPSPPCRIQREIWSRFHGWRLIWSNSLAGASGKRNGTTPGYARYSIQNSCYFASRFRQIPRSIRFWMSFAKMRGAEKADGALQAPSNFYLFFSSYPGGALALR